MDPVTVSVATKISPSVAKEIRSPGWVEIPLVVTILFGALYITRRKHYSIIPRKPSYPNSFLDTPSDSDSLLDETAVDKITLTTTTQRKQRSCLSIQIHTPNTARFKNNPHSRMLQKFPFLVEICYWTLTYLFYRCTKIAAQAMFSSSTIWDVAEANGIRILDLEHKSWLRGFFPLQELDVQHWFIDNHSTVLTALNWIYAFVHIPASVGFIAWYYYAAPTPFIFAIARRTTTLMNLLAFLTFIIYPCAPPRLLPTTYGFVDTVRHETAQSVFARGKYVNNLAAMPSMHFGYAFCIGVTLVAHSGVDAAYYQSQHSLLNTPNITVTRRIRALLYLAAGFAYPALICTVVIVTANHYYLDVIVGATYAALAFWSNHVLCIFLPIEDCLLWILRIEKPVPTTGSRRDRGKEPWLRIY